jgi:uncharacterized protein YecT (DUF1311 family)
MRQAIAAVAVILSASAPAYAAEKWTPDQNKCSDEANTSAIEDCYEKRIAFWDKRLNQAYGQLMAVHKDEPKRAAFLKTAQQAWIKYRDANLAYYGSEDGTISRVSFVMQKLQMTQDRAIELQTELPQ